MADILELEESEIFDDQDDIFDDIVKKDPAAAPHDKDAGFSSDDETTGTHGLDFELEGTATAERLTVQATAQPVEIALRAAELGASMGGSSELGSLKRFEAPPSLHRRPYSDGDLCTVSASMPLRPFSLAMPAGKSPIETGQAAADYASAGGYLGTSMPIRIPMMQRRLAGVSPASLEGRPATFIPPHLLDLRADPTDAIDAGTTPLAVSPTAAVKREKLMARNAILRSTGFLEDAPLVAAAGAPGLPIPAGPRHTATSSLTKMLGTPPTE